MKQSGLFSICIGRKYYVMYILDAKYNKLGKNIQYMIEDLGITKIRNIMENINIIYEDQVMPYPVEWRSSYRVNYIDNILKKNNWIQEYGYEDLTREPKFEKDIKYIYMIDLDTEKFIVDSFDMCIKVPLDEIGTSLILK